MIDKDAFARGQRARQPLEIGMSVLEVEVHEGLTIN